MALTDAEKNQIFNSIWQGRTTERNLPNNLYIDTGNGLRSALFQGFAQVTEAPAPGVVAALNRNIYMFSAAKTFQQVHDMTNFIVDDRGFIRPFRDFQADVNPIYDQFNVEWQRTEFDTAVAQAQGAAQWEEIQNDKEIFPLLKYQTAADERVRPEHADWDNIVRPVDDPFWNDHTPPNGWNCRCTLFQLTEGEERITNIGNVRRNQDPLFSMNPGKDQVIFMERGKDQHPYFKVDREFRVLKSRNFDLPLPEGGEAL